MNHEEVIKAFGERKLNSKTKTVKWTGHHVYCEGDFLYSYGSHFLLAKHLGDNLFVVNSDGYSVSTSRHQGLTRQYCPGPILSNCLLRKEKFSLHDLFHKDILFYVRDQWHWCVKDIETNIFYDNYSYDEQFGSTLTDEYEPPALGVFKSRRKPFPETYGNLGLTKPTHILPLYAECFEWIDPYWPCGKALIESAEGISVLDYFSTDVATPVHIGIHYSTISRAIQTTFHPLARESMTNTFFVSRQRITVKETGLAGIRFLREHNLQTSENCLVLDLLQQPPKRNVLEVLVRLLTQVHPQLPAVVLANDYLATTMLEAVSDDELANVVEVVLQSEVSLLAFPLGIVLVELLVDTLANATVDQYGSRCLVCSYHSKVVQPDVHTRYAFCFALVLCGLFILNIHDKPETLGRQDYLFVGSGAVDAEAIVGWCDSVRLLLNFVLSSLNGFVVEDDLSELIFVIRWFRSFDELGRVFLEGVECFLEVCPVG